MKKVILTLVFAVFTAFAFGQSAANYCGGGHDDHQGRRCVEIDQRNDSCDPEIRNPEICVSDRNAALNAGASYSDIRQAGKGNIATVTQKDANQAVIVQNGKDSNNKNEVVVDQEDGGSLFWMNTAYITQDGEGNYAEAIQSGKRNELDIDQKGDDNSSTVKQSGLFQDAEVDQDGDDNTADVNQKHFKNEAKVEQVGCNNTSDQVQERNLNNACVEQIGHRNDATQKQDLSSSFLSGKNIAMITQGRNGRKAYDSEATQTQNGSFNKAYISQYRDDNKATQTQSGWSNYAESRQNGASGLLGLGKDNESIQIQVGVDNEALVEQDGWNHKATQDQDGKDNTAISIQQNGFSLFGGDKGNTSMQIQVDDNNYSYIHQGGRSNYAESDQATGDQVSYIRQNTTGLSFLFGGNNTAIVSQGK